MERRCTTDEDRQQVEILHPRLDSAEGLALHVRNDGSIGHKNDFRIRILLITLFGIGVDDRRIDKLIEFGVRPMALIVIGGGGEVLVEPVRCVGEVGTPAAGVTPKFAVARDARQSL